MSFQGNAHGVGRDHFHLQMSPKNELRIFHNRTTVHFSRSGWFGILTASKLSEEFFVYLGSFSSYCKYIDKYMDHAG